MNTTRRPERIGGVWVATLTPATSTSARLRPRGRARARGHPSAAKDDPDRAGTGDRERGEERLVAGEDVARGVQPEHLELRAFLLGHRHLPQTGHCRRR